MKAVAAAILIITLLVWGRHVSTPTYDPYDQAASPEFDAEGQNAYDTLNKAEYFALGGVGRGGTMSAGEGALRLLLKQKHAEGAFVRLVRQGSDAGKLYGLVGLKELHSAALPKAVEPLLTSKASVGIQGGCLTMPAKVKDTALYIQEGFYRLGPER